MPQQTTIATMNNAAATNKPTFNPKKGTTSRPTSGRVHNHMVIATAMSSKPDLNFSNMSTSGI